MKIGLAGDQKAKASIETFEPEFLNGWPLFGRGGAGHVPMAGPGDDSPIELGVDLTDLFENLEGDEDDEAGFFVDFSRAAKSKAVGQVHECAVRFYDAKGGFLREVPLKIKGGKFGNKPLKLTSTLKGLKS